MVRKEVKCRKCFEVGHWASRCPNPEKCLDCLQEGHRRGSENCPKVIKDFGGDDDSSSNRGDGKYDSDIDDDTKIDQSDATSSEVSSDDDATEVSMVSGSDCESDASVSVTDAHGDQGNDNQKKKVILVHNQNTCKPTFYILGNYFRGQI